MVCDVALAPLVGIDHFGLAQRVQTTGYRNPTAAGLGLHLFHSCGTDVAAVVPEILSKATAAISRGERGDFIISEGFEMNNQLTRNTGWAAYLSGITALLSFATILVFFIFDGPQTMQSDSFSQQTLASGSSTLFQGLSVLFMIPIALALYRMVETHSANLSRIAMIVGIVGMSVLFLFSLLVILNVMPEAQAGVPISYAFGAIGVWLIAANYFARGRALPSPLAWLGIVIGAAFLVWTLMYWISGAANVASPAALQSNPAFLIGVVALSLSNYILYPIWAIWLGRVLQGESRVNVLPKPSY